MIPRVTRQAIAVLLLLTACADPTVAPWSILCEGGEACPLGLTCLDDGFCHDSIDDEICAASCVGCVQEDGPYNLAFVSSEVYIPGQLGGVEGADAECARLAAAADPPLP